jgi:hypothetical protein
MKQLVDNSSIENKYYGKGIFVDKCTILSVEDISNYPLKPRPEGKLEYGNNGWIPDLALILVVNVNDKEEKFFVMGKFRYKKDFVSGKIGEYLGWDSRGNAVQNLLVKLLGNKAIVNDDDSIDPKTLQMLIGKEFYRLRYCQTADKMYEGKPSFQKWTVFEPADNPENIESLLSLFRKQSSFIKSYDPLLYDNYKENLEENKKTDEENGIESDAVPF